MVGIALATFIYPGVEDVTQGVGVLKRASHGPSRMRGLPSMLRSPLVTALAIVHEASYDASSAVSRVAPSANTTCMHAFESCRQLLPIEWMGHKKSELWFTTKMLQTQNNFKGQELLE